MAPRDANMQNSLCKIIEQYNEVDDKLDILRHIMKLSQAMYNKELINRRLLCHPYTEFLRHKDGLNDTHTYNKEGQRLFDLITITQLDKVEELDGRTTIDAKVQFDFPSKITLSCQYTSTNKSQIKDSEIQEINIPGKEKENENGKVISFMLNIAKSYQKPQELIEFVLETPDIYPHGVYEIQDDKNDFIEDFGEEVVQFHFNYETLEILEKELLLAKIYFSSDEILSFILALPFSEEEWMIDERILNILDEQSEEDNDLNDNRENNSKKAKTE